MRKALPERTQMLVELRCLRGIAMLTGVFDKKGMIVGMLDCLDKEHTIEKWEKELGAFEIIANGQLVYYTD